MKANSLSFRVSFGLFFLPIVLCSCTQSVGEKEYISWVEDYGNGLHVLRPLGDYSFDLQYKPAEYIYLQNKDITNHAAVDDIAEDDMQYFTLTIGLTDSAMDFIDYNTPTMAQKSAKLYHFSFKFQEEIYLEEHNEKIPCVLYHFERSYDLKASRTFVLGFESPNREAKSTKLVIDSPWFNTGPVKFIIDKSSIPELKHPTNAS